MTALPVTLEPWALWLNLFPPELANAVGELLLRLHPLVGKLNTATLERGAEPAGVGNIVQRGQYERLLMTEWLYADAEPDEFVRRAGSGELLFIGPEPATNQVSRRSIALFDTGISQLGEPRLAHLALFILLARRAHEAGAQFLWGSWQQPGSLVEDVGLEGLRRFIRSRTLLAAPNDATQQWETSLGNDIEDCWLIGVNGDSPKQSRERIAIRRALIGNHLNVSLQQRRDYRTVQLELPDPQTGVRLLRKPFVPIAPQGVIHHQNNRASRAQAPRFSSGGSHICVPQLNGGAIVYQVPKTASQKPGKFRLLRAPTQGSILAAGVFKPQLSYITTSGGTLSFHGFPGPLFSRKNLVCERPPMEEFSAPPGMARWLRTFYLIWRQNAKQQEYVIVLDTKHRLVCWQATQSTSSSGGPKISFRHILDNVIGHHQLNDTLFIACADNDGVQLYSWRSQNASPTKIHRIDQQGDLLLYGALKGIQGGHIGSLIAIRKDSKQWWVGSYHRGAMMEIDDGASVLGVAFSQKHDDAGLVVMHPGRRRVEFRVGRLRYEVLTSLEPIQQVCMEAVSRRVAWITDRSCSVIVQGIDDPQPLLQITSSGGGDDA